MSNPARRLHEIYQGWAAGYGPTAEARGARGLDPNSPDTYASQVESFRLILAIEHALVYLESKSPGMAIYRKQFPQWVNISINYPGNWTGGSDPEASFPQSVMDHLHTFSILLDFDNPGLMPEPEAKLRDVIQSIVTLLIEDDSLSQELREYIFKLTNEVRAALDDEAITGSFDFAGAAQRMWVSVFAAAGQSKKMKTKWKATAGRLFQDASATALGSLPAVSVTLAQIQAAQV